MSTACHAVGLLLSVRDDSPSCGALSRPSASECSLSAHKPAAKRCKKQISNTCNKNTGVLFLCCPCGIKVTLRLVMDFVFSAPSDSPQLKLNFHTRTASKVKGSDKMCRKRGSKVWSIFTWRLASLPATYESRSLSLSVPGYVSLSLFPCRWMNTPADSASILPAASEFACHLCTEQLSANGEARR